MESSSSSLRVLFVGNSFTYANDLDKVFTLFMRSRGIVVEAKRVAKGGYSFVQHLKDLENSEEELYSLLGEGSQSEQRWDYVILQDQSQIPGTFQYTGLWESSKEALLQLAAIATKKGATVVLLQTWAHREGNYDRSNAFFTQLFPDYPTMQRLLITGYEMYKTEIEKAVPGSIVVIAPAGKAWNLIYDTMEGGRADSGSGHKATEGSRQTRALRGGATGEAASAIPDGGQNWLDLK
ncbi:hypothetical protein KFL_003490110 [Klebsormidium nitens]|uniref:DUF4886 domain-containing protein n=1 Tax=Klebsormidium nitens TaxID=105231 RepID=A0A1Y1ID74_KLENI|nr:hypothetical protein KFL_003490110 [Klebsormidium nitens]|eukprot:GAQ87389.1 hypothetical protein KFL_003490110 [Klebsormidium nitens]